jgi:hypothetical protein
VTYQAPQQASPSHPICPNGHQVPTGAQFCPACSLPVGSLVCSRGHSVAPGQRYCPQCGAQTGPWRSNLTGPDYVRPYEDQVSDWWAASGPTGRRLAGPDQATLLAWRPAGGLRLVGASVIDFMLGWFLVWIPWIGPIIGLGIFFAQSYFEGTTGQTLGKKALGIYTIKKDTGEFLGGAIGIGRQLLHILDTLAFFTGWIVGLFITRTYADMIVGSTVVRKPRQALPLPNPAQPSYPPVTYGETPNSLSVYGGPTSSAPQNTQKPPVV